MLIVFCICMYVCMYVCRTQALLDQTVVVINQAYIGGISAVDQGLATATAQLKYNTNKAGGNIGGTWYERTTERTNERTNERETT
jgi:hypothetical protein